jgi:hypothetical protein
MKKLNIIFAAIAICFGITTNTFAQYVTAEFVDFGGAEGTTFNRVRMDKPGVPYSHNVDGVTAQFYSGGSRDLVIALNSGKCKRTITYDFTEVSSVLNIPAWWYTNLIQSFKPNMNVLEAYRAKENCKPDSKGVYNCDFQTRMNNGYLYASGDSATYALLWNPEPRNDRKVNSPEMTSFVNVNYQKDALGDVYTITPLPNCATRNNNFTCPNYDEDGKPIEKRVIAGLEKTSGKTVSSAGQFVMPFTLVVRPKQ